MILLASGRTQGGCTWCMHIDDARERCASMSSSNPQSNNTFDVAKLPNIHDRTVCCNWVPSTLYPLYIENLILRNSKNSPILRYSLS